MVMSGLEWWAYETVKDLVAEAISVAQGFEQMMGWEEWEDIGQEGREKEKSQEVEESNSTEILRRKKRGKLVSKQPSIVRMFKKLEEKKNKTANTMHRILCIEYYAYNTMHRILCIKYYE